MAWPDAVAAIKARIEANWPNGGVDLRFENAGGTLDDVPEAFVYVEILAEGQVLSAFGGGRGNNEWLQYGAVMAHVFVPIGSGRAVADGYAEDLAAILRGRRFDPRVSCGAAGPLDAGGLADDGNYWRTTVRAEVDHRFFG